MKENHNVKKSPSITSVLKKSYAFIITILILPAVFSTVISFFYTNSYNVIISDIVNANKITQIVENELPAELWNIVCGKKVFTKGTQYALLRDIDVEIKKILKHTKNPEDIKTLEVASRTRQTLYRNINFLGQQIYLGLSVEENEILLDEIRSICILFSDVMGNYIVSQIDITSKLNKKIQRAAVINLSLEVFLIMLAIFVSFRGIIKLSHFINDPISQMEELTRKVSEGDLSVRLEKPYVKEIDNLALNLNRMTEQIDILIKQNIEEQKNLQKVEMKALQAQITPHFLYNTFDTIIWLAEEKRTEEVIKITSAFSQFLRTSLSRGHEWITVEQELEHVKNYLTIQKVRYADIMNYTIDADENLNQYKMLKLTLQPLIENAIYHGIKNKRGRGNLKLTARFADEEKTKMYFCVEDDGAGFTEERLAEVMNELKVGEQETLASIYGLYNVNKKLILYYNDGTDGINIETQKGKGSKIYFTIPCIRKGEFENV